MTNVLRTQPRHATGGPAQQAYPARQRWRAFTLLVVAYFITIVDFTIVNVALPDIGRALHFPQAGLQWVVTAFVFLGTLYMQQVLVFSALATGAAWMTASVTSLARLDAGP